jgi:DNA-binding NtrC family response regulator
MITPIQSNKQELDSSIVSIIHVDDQDCILDISKKILERRKNISVDSYSHPSQIIQALQTKMYHMIISDYEMPEMDGITLLQEVRQINPVIPFIFFSGRDIQEIKPKTIHYNNVFYVQKTGNIDQIYTSLFLLINQITS